MGIRNIGNTCYLAAALQCLLQCQHFTKNVHLLKASDPFVKLFLNLHKELSMGNRVVDPTDFYKSLRNHYPYFDNQDEHDAHEAMQVILDMLSTRCARMPHPFYVSRNRTAARQWFGLAPTNIIDETFRVQLENTVTCGSCKHTIVSYQCEYGLFEQSVCKDKPLEEYQCDKCRKFGNCMQTIRMHHAPPCLILKSTVCNHNNLVVNNQRYRLIAVCKHSQLNRNNGHYVAAVCEQHGWVLKDDERSTPLLVKGVERDNGCVFVFEICG